MPYSYLWNFGYSIEDLTGLSAGNYELTVTDANGCITTISQSITEPAIALNAHVFGSNISCFGGSKW